jgi:hypothetical protein
VDEIRYGRDVKAEAGAGDVGEEAGAGGVGGVKEAVTGADGVLLAGLEVGLVGGGEKADR